jgi:hypothetical protein
LRRFKRLLIWDAAAVLIKATHGNSTQIRRSCSLRVISTTRSALDATPIGLTHNEKGDHDAASVLN